MRTPIQNRPSRSWPLVVALLAVPVLAGCPSTPPREGPGPRTTQPDAPRDIKAEPSYWASNAQAEKDEYIVTDSLAVTDTEANAETELRDKAMQRAVELTVKDLLRDEQKFRDNENEIRRLIIAQWQKFVVSHEIVEKRRFGDNRMLGVKIKVKADRGKIAKTLQDEKLFREDQEKMRTVLVFRKPAQGAAEVDEGAQGYIDDIEERLSREMAERGFEPKLWRKLRQSIAERRDAGDRRVNDLLSRFVEESEYQKQSDESYGLPMLVLRSEGRLLIGFKILELEKKGLAYHCTMRADAYDLLNERSLGSLSESHKKALADQTLIAARQALVEETADRLNKKICDSLQDFLDRTRKEKKRDYTFTFDGYTEEELARLETLFAGIFAEDIDSSNDGKTLAIRTKIPRDPIPVRDEVMRSLDRLGLSSKPAKRDGNNMSFTKKG